MTKFCVNCSRLNEFNNCGYPMGHKKVTNLLTGRPLGTAKDPQEMRTSEAYCGSKGVWYKDNQKCRQPNKEWRGMLCLCSVCLHQVNPDCGCNLCEGSTGECLNFVQTLHTEGGG